MAEMTREQFAAARERGEELLRGPRAHSAHYDAGRNRIIVRLTTGIEIGFAPADAEGLEHATVEDLRRIEVEALGLGLHFPSLDADIYVPALLEGVLGSERWMKARAATALAGRRRARRSPSGGERAGRRRA